MHHSTHTILCCVTVLIALALFFSAARAEFRIKALNKKEFGFVRGAETCPPVFFLDAESDVVPASAIAINRKPCAGAALTLKKNPATGGNLLTALLRGNQRRGVSYEGTIGAGNLTCAEASVGLVDGTYFQFFQPLNTLTVNFASVFADEGGSQSALATNSTADFQFLEANDYLVVSSQCLYSRQANDDGSSCFPATATVALQHGSFSTMDMLSIGDSVLVAKDTYSPVFMWTHRDGSHKSTNYITLATAAASLTLTPGHHVHLASSSRTIEARHVRVGDVVLTTANSGGEPIISIKRGVQASGLYNPQTLDGRIVVDGIQVSTYTSAIRPDIAHAALAPLRLAYRAFAATGAFADKPEL
jgi:Hint module